MEFYRFRARRLPIITKGLIDSILGRSGRVRVSFDMGISFTELDVGDGLDVGGCWFSFDDLKGLRGEYVYAVVDCRLWPVAFFRGKYFYKLYPVSPFNAPTLEISGIKMHRVVGITPWRDAALKVDALKGLRGKRVLDICTGLGYTAIHAYRRGADVVSIEVDENVLDIASYNPWSADLENVNIVLGDAYEVVHEFDSGEFDAIIHDPPRFSLAGHLYSVDFYSELYRVLRRGGSLFHYAGKVGYRRRGIDIVKGVASRLARAGFRVRLMRDLRGVLAFKP